MDIRIKYGRTHISFNVPESAIAAVVRPRCPAAHPDPDPYLSRTLGPRLEPARADFTARDVLVLMADATRDQPHRAAYAAVAPLLTQARSVRVILATGTHKPNVADDWRILNQVRQVSADRRIPIAALTTHDCRKSPCFIAGTTPFGNEIRLHSFVESAQAILILSDTRPHYFAGYSNAIKFLLPGVASFESIERNHAFALDPDAATCRHPLHPDPARRRNPVAEDQLQAARLVTARVPVYALVTVSMGPDVAWATFGPLEDVVTEGIRFVDEHLVETVVEKHRRLVIGCGGYPADETLYTAQRALEHTKEAVADGAEILWLAECRNGVASSDTAVRNFFTPLRQNTEAYVRQVRRKYVMFAHKTVKLVELLDRLRTLRVFSGLPAGTLPVGRMVACADPQALVADWVRRGERIAFIEDAGKLAVQFRESRPQEGTPLVNGGKDSPPARLTG